MKLNSYKIRLIIAGVIGILSIFAIWGLFYPVRFFNLQLTALAQRAIFDFSIFAILLFISVIVLTIIFGRFYCSTICPFGILQEFFSFIRGKKENTKQGNFGFKYLIAGLTFGALIAGSAIFIRYFDPFAIFGSAFSFSLFGLIVTFAILALTFFKNRFFCTNICPVGAILGLISKVSLNKIYINKDNCVSCKMCVNSCPSGCISYEEKTVDNETCVKCLKCLNVCKGNAIKYGIQPVKFSLKRRGVLWGMGALAILAAGYSAGLHFTKNVAEKVRNVILPAGAVNPNRMANKCLNCNLCVNNCPNKILSKADDEFGTIHIDYSKGKGYCGYKCHRCSEVCPSGAIKKLKLEEKQKTKIATAKIDDNCMRCGGCVSKCPKDAIKWDWEDGARIVVDESKCIGCGKCASICPAQAIKMLAAKEQSII